MKNLVGCQIGKYKVLEKMNIDRKDVNVYKGCHFKDHSLRRMNVYHRETLGDQIDVLREEVDLLQMCRSPHILGFHEKFETKDMYIIVTDFYANTLEDEIQKKNGLKEVDAIRIMKHIIKGLSKLHQFDTIYRCLEPKYISKVGESYVLNDLKHCKRILHEDTKRQISNFSNPIVIAPEIHQRRSSGYEADVWSLGVTLFMMIANKCPEMDGQKLLIDRTQNKFSNHTISFLMETMKPDKKTRLSWKAVLTHPIFLSKSTLFFDFTTDLDLDEELEMYNNKNLIKESEGDPRSEIHLPRSDTTIVFVEQLPESNLKQSIKYLSDEDERNEKVESYALDLKFHYLKSMFFYQEIFKAFEALKDNINVAQRLKIEFQYLILIRSLFILSPVQQILKQGKNKFHWEFYEAFRNHSFCMVFVQEFNLHYKQILVLKNDYSTLLTNHEDKLTTKVTDFFWKRIDNYQYKQYERFLTGIEPKDFTLQEFYMFLKKEYIDKILEAIKNEKSRPMQRFKVALDEITRVMFLEKPEQRLILQNVYINLPML